MMASACRIRGLTKHGASWLSAGATELRRQVRSQTEFGNEETYEAPWELGLSWGAAEGAWKRRGFGADYHLFWWFVRYLLARCRRGWSRGRIQ
jgi:hypothetical protein